MKVIYKKTILEQVMAILTRSTSDYRQIEKILLTPGEWDQCKSEHYRMTGDPGTYSMIAGIKIELEKK